MHWCTYYLLFQIWNLGSPDPNFTLDAHQKGVNCVDYFTGGDKPYLITGSDDHTAKVLLKSLVSFFCCICFHHKAQEPFWITINGQD
jgi:coatomer subunit beta'